MGIFGVLFATQVLSPKSAAYGEAGEFSVGYVANVYADFQSPPPELRPGLRIIIGDEHSIVRSSNDIDSDDVDCATDYQDNRVAWDERYNSFRDDANQPEVSLLRREYTYNYILSGRWRRDGGVPDDWLGGRFRRQ